MPFSCATRIGPSVSNERRSAVHEHSRFRAISPIAVDLSVGHDAGMRRKQRGLWAGPSGSPLCPYCGEEAIEQQRLSGSDRFRHWLRFGGPVPGTATCVNGHEWEGGSQSSLYRMRTGAPRWLWLPVELFRVVHRERSMVPVPVTYLAAAGVGIVVGVILDVVVGWPWWLIAVGFVAAVWLVFLSSALWGRRGTLTDDLMRVIDAQRVEAAELARLEAAVAAGRLVCFQVDGWEGSRSLRGWGGVREATSVTLLHGDIEHDDSWLSIETREDVGQPDPPGYQRRDELIRELLRALNRPPEGLDIEQMYRWHLEERRRIDQIEAPPWSPVIVTIDGHDVSADVAEIAGGWALAVTSKGKVIELAAKGHRPDAIPLTPVTTLRPFIEGLQALRQRHRLEHDP